MFVGGASRCTFVFSETIKEFVEFSHEIFLFYFRFATEKLFIIIFVGFKDLGLGVHQFVIHQDGGTNSEGERHSKKLGALLTILDPANLRWVGKVHPATDTIKDMLENIHATQAGAARADLVPPLMDYMMKPETLEFVERYPTFKTCIIDKCNELRLLHVLDYPKVAAKCLEVLGVLGGDVTPLSKAQLEAAVAQLLSPQLVQAQLAQLAADGALSDQCSSISYTHAQATAAAWPCGSAGATCWPRTAWTRRP